MAVCSGRLPALFRCLRAAGVTDAIILIAAEKPLFGAAVLLLLLLLAEVAEVAGWAAGGCREGAVAWEAAAAVVFMFAANALTAACNALSPFSSFNINP